ncbi:hypothetical protein KQH40_00915 [bacterium]|nr:hypothetical protein [bacterium]
MQGKVLINRKKAEQGDTILEFTASLPLFILLFFTLGAAVWVFWSQAVADVVAAMASREASFNRGGNLVLPSYGYTSFSESTSYLTGGQTAEAIGTPQISRLSGFRMIVMEVFSDQGLSFGPIDTDYTFNGGSASRYWIFYGGPPAPWE